mmetsp:Transcript_5468/g.21623  ORF Transcript_5468/g.21623 Transcript_5468/m.21623 type:complete len:337 (-) Transcript_5468:33-1043(-)|eukprot:scaffold1247_cov251-Pinguiococcus_pyrenoidosus.AAC.3
MIASSSPGLAPILLDALLRMLVSPIVSTAHRSLQISVQSQKEPNAERPRHAGYRRHGRHPEEGNRGRVASVGRFHDGDGVRNGHNDMPHGRQKREEHAEGDRGVVAHDQAAEKAGRDGFQEVDGHLQDKRLGHPVLRRAGLHQHHHRGGQCQNRSQAQEGHQEVLGGEAAADRVRSVVAISQEGPTHGRRAFHVVRLSGARPRWLPRPSRRLLMLRSAILRRRRAHPGRQVGVFGLFAALAGPSLRVCLSGALCGRADHRRQDSSIRFFACALLRPSWAVHCGAGVEHGREQGFRGSAYPSLRREVLSAVLDLRRSSTSVPIWGKTTGSAGNLSEI